jgi:hypothetical protein
MPMQLLKVSLLPSLRQRLFLSLWANVRSDRIINVVVCTPAPLLWKVIDIGTEECTGDYIARVILGAIAEIEEKTRAHVASVVTDNAASMQRAWRIVQESRPRILTFWLCCALC